MVKNVLAQKITDAKAEGWWKYVRQGPGQEADEQAMLDGCKIDLRAALRWCRLFTESMKTPEGEQFELLDFQRNQIIVPLFGWKRENGNRRYRKGGIWIAKKNGKTTLIGGLVAAFLKEYRNNSRAYACAYSRDQATTLYEQAASICRNSKIGRKYRILPGAKIIRNPRNNNSFKVLPGIAGARGLDGLISNLSIIDEVHEHPTDAVFERLDHSIAADDNGLVLTISTVGVEDEEQIWHKLYTYAHRVLRGEIVDHSFFAFIAQADPDCKDDKEKRHDPEQWRKANPGLGKTVSEADFRDALNAAENDPSLMQNFLRRRLNIPTAVLEQCLNMDNWKEMGSDAEDWPDLTRRPCFAGLDLASSEDLAALILYFPPTEEDKKGYLMSRLWCPEQKIIERKKKGNFNYDRFIDRGDLIATKGQTINYKKIEAEILYLASIYRIEELAYDPWNAEGLVQQIEYDVECVKVSQQIRPMTIGTKAFMEAIVNKSFLHEDNECMTWCCGNAAEDPKSSDEYKRFSKEHSSDKIDGAVAAAMAFGRAAVAEPEGISTYDMEGGGVL